MLNILFVANTERWRSDKVVATRFWPFFFHFIIHIFIIIYLWTVYFNWIRLTVYSSTFLNRISINFWLLFTLLRNVVCLHSNGAMAWIRLYSLHHFNECEKCVFAIGNRHCLYINSWRTSRNTDAFWIISLKTQLDKYKTNPTVWRNWRHSWTIKIRKLVPTIATLKLKCVNKSNGAARLK